MRENLINLDDYDKSLLNNVEIEGIVGKTFERPKYVIFYLTTVSVHQGVKTRHTFEVMVWKQAFKSIPTFKRGMRIVVKGHLRMIRKDEDDDRKSCQIVAEKITF